MTAANESFALPVTGHNLHFTEQLRLEDVQDYRYTDPCHNDS